MIRLAAVLMALSAPAWGAACNLRPIVVSALQAEEYQEQQRGAGLHRTGYILEVWSGPNGTWTILKTTPDNISCVLAAGSHWRDTEPEPLGEDG